MTSLWRRTPPRFYKNTARASGLKSTIEIWNDWSKFKKDFGKSNNSLLPNRSTEDRTRAWSLHTNPSMMVIDKLTLKCKSFRSIRQDKTVLLNNSFKEAWSLTKTSTVSNFIQIPPKIREPKCFKIKKSVR